MIVRVKSTGNTELWIEHTPDSNTKYKVELISSADLVSVQATDQLGLSGSIFISGGQVFYALASDSDTNAVRQFIEDTK